MKNEEVSYGKGRPKVGFFGPIGKKRFKEGKGRAGEEGSRGRKWPGTGLERRQLPSM